jgi:hypothetical protein
MVNPELARAMVEERIRDAQKTHRFSSDPRPRRLSSILRSWLPHFIHL